MHFGFLINEKKKKHYYSTTFNTNLFNLLVNCQNEKYGKLKEKKFTLKLKNRNENVSKLMIAQTRVPACPINITISTYLFVSVKGPNGLVASVPKMTTTTPPYFVSIF